MTLSVNLDHPTPWQAFLINALKPLPLPETAVTLKARPAPGSGRGHVAIVDIDRGLAKLATIIEMHGDDYWPLFERLEAERERILNRVDRLASVKARINMSPADYGSIKR